MYLPPPIRQLYDAWMAFSHVLGRVMSFIILTVFWIVGIGSYAIVLKCIGWMHRDEPNPTSYWKTIASDELSDMRRQF
jgi:hypothetical protein